MSRFPLIPSGGMKNFSFKEAVAFSFKVGIVSVLVGIKPNSFQFRVATFSGDYLSAGADDYIYALQPGNYFCVQLDNTFNFKAKTVYAKCENGKEAIMKNNSTGNVMFVLAL